MVGVRHGGKPGNQPLVQEPDRRRVSGRRGPGLSRGDEAAVQRKGLESSSSVQRTSYCPADRRALAHYRHAAESAVFRLHDAQRAGRISRLSLVLLHERATAPLPEHALSARLRHGAAPLLLALPSAVAVSLERLLSGCCETELQAGGPRRQSPPAGSLLDRLHPGLLHLLDHAGILFDAVLSGARAAARIGDGGGRQLDPLRDARPLRNFHQPPQRRCLRFSPCRGISLRPAIFQPRSVRIPEPTSFRSATWKT